jgi:Zn-dependent protease with chaperone function
MPFDMGAIRHSREKIYNAIMLLTGVLLWASLALFLLAMVAQGQMAPVFMVLGYLAAGLVTVWIVTRLTRAYMIGHYVKVGPEQFPNLHKMVSDGSAALGLKEVPHTYVYNSSGVMNAMALRLVGSRRYVWLTSALIDADNDEQVRFVIGHELGHHRAGHLDAFTGFLRLPAFMIPFLGSAYSRAREFTCDRIGAWLVQDSETARSALQMLGCGSARLNASMNTAAYEQQEKEVPAIAGFFISIFSTHPRLTRRVKAVNAWFAAQDPAIKAPRMDTHLSQNAA